MISITPRMASSGLLAMIGGTPRWIGCAGELAVPEPRQRHGEHDQQPQQAALTPALAVGAGIDLMPTQQRTMLHLCDVHFRPPLRPCADGAQ